MGELKVALELKLSPGHQQLAELAVAYANKCDKDFDAAKIWEKRLRDQKLNPVTSKEPQMSHELCEASLKAKAQDQQACLLELQGHVTEAHLRVSTCSAWFAKLRDDMLGVATAMHLDDWEVVLGLDPALLKDILITTVQETASTFSEPNVKSVLPIISLMPIDRLQPGQILRFGLWLLGGRAADQQTATAL